MQRIERRLVIGRFTALLIYGATLILAGAHAGARSAAAPTPQRRGASADLLGAAGPSPIPQRVRQRVSRGGRSHRSLPESR